MSEKKDFVDSIFDFADRVADGAAYVLKDMPDPDGDDSDDEKRKVIDVPVETRPLLKSGSKKQRREVELVIKNVAPNQKGGVTLIAETPVHEIVAVHMSKEDFMKLVDAADWLF